ncbi:MAG: acyl carrier protein [Anaerolineaceae bacterium]|jgi:acyl carrier protein
MTDDMVNELGQLIAEKIIKQPGRTLKADQALISSGLVDSFSLVDLALLVEDTYGVRIDDSELNADTFDTLEQLAALIRSRK